MARTYSRSDQFCNSSIQLKMLKRDKAKVLVRMEVLVTDDRQSLLAIFCCCLLSTQVHLPRLTHSTEQRLVISHDLFI